MQNMTISALRQSYIDGSLSPAALLADIRQRTAQYQDRNIFIHALSDTELAPYLAALANKDIYDHPLWGIPFVIKDNIDLAGVDTSAGCPAFSYRPDSSAQVVKQLIAAGAIPLGKANLDQFATGLNGTRSPFGACRNAFDPAYISGGSSSGSAVAVALGLASFSLGTDTAGSGRVPACFNNLVGLKPSRGLLSATGLVPACRSLDCISIFTLDCDDANTVLAIAEGFDENDGYSRVNPYSNQGRHYGEHAGPLKVGIIPEAQLAFFGDSHYQAAYQDTLAQLRQQGFECVEIDYQPFDEAAKLLYEGPWVAERYLACQPLIDEQPDAIFPVVRTIVEAGAKPSAAALFKAQYRLAELAIRCRLELGKVDCLLTPTAGRHFTVEEMLAEPVTRNSQLGYYTNFMNLVDMAAVSVPTAFTAGGMPFGITLAGEHFSDRALLAIARRIESALMLPLGATGVARQAKHIAKVEDRHYTDLLVCGAHLQGLPLNWQLTERGAMLKVCTETAPVYRMYALAGGPPLRPGLMRDPDNGAAIAVEVWRIPTPELGSFVAAIPEPLGIGKVELADGHWVSGFICDAHGLAGAEDITAFGGWRAWLAAQPQ